MKKIELQQIGHLGDSVNILSVTENGLTFLLPFQVKEGSKIKISSPMFKDVGMEDPYLRIIKTEPDKENPDVFYIEAEFLSVIPDVVEKIRKWLSDNTPES